MEVITAPALIAFEKGRVTAGAHPRTSGRVSFRTPGGLHPPPPPIADAAMDGLLETPDQLKTVMGTTNMVSKSDASTLTDDSNRITGESV